MADWQAGDLALCVSVTHPKFMLPSTKLAIGKVYTVEIVGVPQTRMDGERALGLVEVKPDNPNRGYPETLFCKIEPHERDAEDDITIDLYKRVPETAGVNRPAQSLPGSGIPLPHTELPGGDALTHPEQDTPNHVPNMNRVAVTETGEG